MSQTYHEHQPLPQISTHSWGFLPKKSQKFANSLHSFERKLAEGLEKLNPNDVDEVFTLNWMRRSFHFLIEAHKDMKSLVDELFPVLSWDNKWTHIYLDDTVKLLDICNAVSSHLSILDRAQLSVRYVQCIFDSSNNAVPSSEQLERAHLCLHDWIKLINSKSPNLQSGLTALKALRETLHIQKTKNAEERALLRAMYEFKFIVVGICSIFLGAFSGSSETVTDSSILEKFLWVEAFDELVSVVRKAIDTKLSENGFVVFKEVEALRVCSIELHDIVGASCDEEELVSQSDRTKWSEDRNSSRKSAEVVRRFCENGEKLGEELDGLSIQVDGFFKVVLRGRDGLLSNLRRI